MRQLRLLPLVSFSLLLGLYACADEDEEVSPATGSSAGGSGGTSAGGSSSGSAGTSAGKGGTAGGAAGTSAGAAGTSAGAAGTSAGAAGTSAGAAGTSAGAAGTSAGAAGTSAGSAGSAGGTAAPLECDVVIVGAGPAGLHTAYKLTNPSGGGAVAGVSDPSKVCLFEKNDRIGGRIRDVQFGATAADVTGTGAYRMYDNHYAFTLATELGVTTVAPVSFSNLRALQDPGGMSGQFFGYSGDAFKAAYSQTINDDDMWVKLLCGDQVPKDAAKHPDYQAIAGLSAKSTLDYVTEVLGVMGAQYFFDQNRFRADFTADVDAIGYLEYGAIDWYGAGAVRYPIPGHSGILNKMREAFEAKGGKLFLSEAVASIDTVSDGTFTVKTAAHDVAAKQVVIATEHGALKKITGDVMTTVTAAKEYQNVTSAKSMQVTHKWDKAWWKGDLRYPDMSKVMGDPLASDAAPILRADTTIRPDGYCINSIEMPFTDHHDSLMVTRTAYSDQRECVDKNLTLYGAGGTAGENALNDELKRSLRILFPAIFDSSSNEPQIVQTDVNTHPEAWYYLKTGAGVAGVTNKTLFDWSVQPVADKKLYLVGDAWYTLGSGWSNAAYISSLRVLNTHFGMTLDTHELQPVSCP
jgi:hypothetical protein